MKRLLIWFVIFFFFAGCPVSYGNEKSIKSLGLYGEVKSVQTIFGAGTPHEFIYEYHFSKDGLLLEELHHFSQKIPPLIIRYDEKGRIIDEVSGSRKTIYLYDEINRKYEVRDHTEQVIYLGELDQEGKLKNQKNGLSSFSDQTDYTYNDKGQLIEIRTVSFLKDRESIKSTLYYLSGYIKEIRWRQLRPFAGKNGKVEKEYEVVFSISNEKGWQITGGHYWENAQGEIVRWNRKQTYWYEDIDRYGNWRTQRSKDELNAKSSIGIVKRKITYYE